MIVCFGSWKREEESEEASSVRMCLSHKNTGRGVKVNENICPLPAAEFPDDTEVDFYKNSPRRTHLWGKEALFTR